MQEDIDEEDLFLTADEIDGVSEEDLEDLQEDVEKYSSMLKKHDEEINEILERINNSNVYEELGIEITVSTEYYYSIEKNEE